MVRLKNNTTFEVETHTGIVKINVDEFGYMRANDFLGYYPNARLDAWLKSDKTQEVVRALESAESITSDNVESGVFVPAVKANRGKYGGTYLHPILALDLAAWLDVNLRIDIYQTYLNHITGRKSWNLKRVESSESAKLLFASIKEFIVDPMDTSGKPYQDEAWLIKSIVLGSKSAVNKHAWDNATENELEMREYLERIDMGLIIAGLSINERRTKLVEQYNKKVKENDRN